MFCFWARKCYRGFILWNKQYIHVSDMKSCHQISMPLWQLIYQNLFFSFPVFKPGVIVLNLLLAVFFSALKAECFQKNPAFFTTSSEKFHQSTQQIFTKIYHRAVSEKMILFFRFHGEKIRVARRKHQKVKSQPMLNECKFFN